MKQLRTLFYAAFLVVALDSHAQSVLPIDPARDWRVLRTRHFEIIYDSSHDSLAHKFADEGERAARFLEPLLQTRVPGRVPVMIADITDVSNGSATGIPRSQIEIYPVLPSVTDPTSEYADWPRELITHEYTHIMNFEPTSGLMAVLRFLFGSIVKPGGYLPRWYTEGLAVEMESKLTPVGRGRSHYYSALVRAMVDDKIWGEESIDRINSTSIPTWPRGQRPYTYGYFLMHHLAEAKGTVSEGSPYGVLNNRYGGRFPWFINGPVEDYFGLDYAGLLSETYKQLARRAESQIKEMGVVKNGHLLAQKGYFNFGPQISPDKLKLAVIMADYNENATIRIWKRPNPNVPFSSLKDEPETIIEAKTIHQISWRADSKTIVYDHLDTYRHFNTVSDLYEVNIDEKNEKRLTHGARAREATVLPDNSLVYVHADPDRTTLVHADSKGENAATLYTPSAGERVSSPRPYSNGIIYSHRDAHGKEWIESLKSVSAGVSPKVLTKPEHTGQMHIMPVADPISPSNFYYASSDTGVLNIYRSDARKARAVTNISTYAYSPTVDPSGGEVIYSRLTSSGFHIEAQSLKEKLDAPKKVTPLIEYTAADEKDPPHAAVEESYKYHGTSYLFPQYLIPFVYFMPGGAIFDLSTTNSDPLRHHEYAADIGYDTRAGQPREEFVYTNSVLPFFVDASFANDYIYLVGASQVEHFTFGELDTRHFLFSDSNKWTVGPNFIYRMTDFGNLLFTEFGPGASLDYNNVTPAKDFQISPEDGESFHLGYEYFLPTWSNTTYQNVNALGSIFLSGKPLPEHHVINFKLSAWVSPPQQTIYTGTQQAGGEYSGALVESQFVVRGYPVGEFIGSTVFVGNFEYRFPLAYTFKGKDTFPAFINKWSAALIADAITLDGGFFDSSGSTVVLRATKLGTYYYMGTGAEVRADMQLFYGIPLTLRLGAYYGLNEKAFGGLNYYLGFGLVQ